MNVWNKILGWFSDRSERLKLVKSFNMAANMSFISGDPTILRACISKGNRNYKHQFSSLFNTGFRIEALSGRSLQRDEIIDIGSVILNNTTLVRQLVTLGFDTLQVHSNVGSYGCQWKLIDYAEIGQTLIGD